MTNCDDIEDFLYTSTPRQDDPSQVLISQRELELYLSRFRNAICDDLEDMSGDISDGMCSLTEPVDVTVLGTVSISGVVSVSNALSLDVEVTEDDVVPASPLLIPIAVERDDVLATLTEADGDWGHLRMSSTGALWVEDVNGVGAGTQDVNIIEIAGNVIAGSTLPVNDGGGTLTVDGSVSLAAAVDLSVEVTEDSVVPASPNLLPIAFERDDALGTLTEADGDWVHPRTNNRGAIWVAHDGDISISDGGNVITVDGTVAATQSGSWTVDIGSQPISVDDNAGSLTVDDGGISLTVDGTVAATQSGAWSVTLGAAADLTVEVAGDSVSGISDQLIPIAAIRDDVLSTLTPVDGDYTQIRVNSTGAIWVEDVSGGGGGGTEYTVDDAAPTNPVAGALVLERDDALSALTPIEGDWQNALCNANGAMWVAHDGDITIADGGNTITVDGTVAATQSGTWNIATLTSITNDVNIADGGNSITVDGSVSLAAAADLTVEVTEDSVVPAAPQLLPIALERDDALGTLTEIDGDWGHARMNSRGAMWIAHDGDITIADGGNTITVDGTVAATQSGTWNIATLTSITNDVNIADGGNVISIDDAGSSITVDGTVAATQSGTWNIGTVTTVTSAGLSVEVAADSVAGGTDQLLPIAAIRDDVLTTLTPIDGDYAQLRLNSTGALWVEDVGGGGGGGTEYTVDDVAPATPTAPSFVMERDDALSTITPVAGDWQHGLCNNRGAMWMIHDGDISIADGGNTITVDGSVDLTVEVAGDSASTGTDQLIPVAVVRDDTLTTLTPIDGDYTVLRVDSTGALHVTDAAAGGGGGGSTWNYLSAQSNGAPIPISTTSAVEIHNSVTGTTDIDLVTVWGYCTFATPVELTVDVGGTDISTQINELNQDLNDPPVKILDRYAINNSEEITVTQGVTGHKWKIWGMVERVTAT